MLSRAAKEKNCVVCTKSSASSVPAAFTRDAPDTLTRAVRTMAALPSRQFQHAPLLGDRPEHGERGNVRLERDLSADAEHSGTLEDGRYQGFGQHQPDAVGMDADQQDRVRTTVRAAPCSRVQPRIGNGLDIDSGCFFVSPTCCMNDKIPGCLSLLTRRLFGK